MAGIVSSWGWSHVGGGGLATRVHAHKISRRIHIHSLTLHRYRLRQRIDIADVSDTYSSWVLPSLLDVSPSPRAAAQAVDSDVAGSSSRGLSTLYAWQRDPRLAALGARCIGPWAQGQAAAQERFARQRYALGVPEGDAEIPHGQAMPLEYNLDALNGVAYDKGCYIGQELVARTHFKGVIRKRLMPVRLAAADPDATPAPPQPGARVAVAGAREGAPAKAALRALCQDAGLALLRLDAALPAARDQGPGLRIDEGEGPAWEVHPTVPDWWPAEWTSAEAGSG